MKLPFPITSDSIAMRGAGVVHVTQPVTGHRFTLDSILLADFCRVKPGERVLEAGAGTGIISLLLAKKHPRAAFFAIEVQPSLASLCEQNITRNGLAGRMQMVRKDLRRIGRTLAPGSLSVIVVNPPYMKEGSGRTSPDRSRRTARQAHTASLESWLNLHRYLKNGGRYCLIFPVARLAELVTLMRKRALEPKRLRLVHPHADRPAALVLVEAVKQGGTGLEVLPPLIVHEQDGGYTEEMKDIYGTSAED
ncbi:MAG: tRNA1(Val) (adenine(37)-N6)-methyltransferase [Nitrospirae bacterium]|nr:tRNA1(Val) (adenine(37)-N6)-methyltransferase [Nitrospirota bacterium]NTW67342.1 tRNA1(Val) (adenine(37)-N6)-methyltransferase [Nitrospirota bacterium]